MKYQALIFDFNGLIIDDEPIHAVLFQKVLLARDIVLTDEDYWETYLGYDDRGLFEAVYLREGKKITPKITKELIAEKNKLYFPALAKNLKFFPGVVEFIREVKKKYVLAIVSGALRSEIEFVLKEGNLAQYFECIVSANEAKHGKPHPEGFVLALTQLKKKHPAILPGNCLVLEDSHAGIDAAHRAQMPVVAMTHTYAREELTAADFVCDNFTEVALML